jgi:hypothetical protein
MAKDTTVSTAIPACKDSTLRSIVADATGRPLYSWRVLLMVELDRTDGWFGGRLAAGFRFDEPWDSPNNSKLP